jgi:hypothetical protein
VTVRNAIVSPYHPQHLKKEKSEDWRGKGKYGYLVYGG